MESKVIPFPVRESLPSVSLDAVTLDVPIRHQHYGRLVRVAALFETSIADVLARVLEKEFGQGQGTEPQPPNSYAA